jgi:uncharacterized protein YcbK (DUF882 family)
LRELLRERRVGVLVLVVLVLGLANVAAHAGRARPGVPAPPQLFPALVAVAAPRAPAPPAFPELPALTFTRLGSPERVPLRLYDASGALDERAAARIDELAADLHDPRHPAHKPLARRTLQLVYRAAYHFRASTVEIVSGYRATRRRREGPHANGSALDFRLPGVPAATLASYLRTLPRVGVGIYTHPRTQYVHLDVREQSFHWLDASPPGKTWRERSLGGKHAARDAAYARPGDWPEHVSPPPAPFTP